MRPEERTAIFRRQVGGHSAGRTIHHDRARALRQNEIDTQGQSQFFTDITTIVIDNGQAIRVGILSETHIGTRLLDGSTQPRQVLFGGLGDMVKFPVGRATENMDITAKSPQKIGRVHPPCPVAAVEDHLQSAYLNRRRIHQPQHSLHVRFARLRQFFDVTQPAIVLQPELFFSQRLQQAFT